MELIFAFISFNSTVNEYLHFLYDYLYANLNSHFFFYIKFILWQFHIHLNVFRLLSPPTVFCLPLSPQLSFSS